MLNEKREYNLYLTSGYGNLLRPDNLADGLKGIRRVLTVLARGFLDICRDAGVTDKERQDAYTVAFLKTWVLGKCTAEYTLPALLHTQFERAASASLLQHLQNHCRKIHRPDDYLNDRLRHWEKTLFDNSGDTKKHSLNAIRFKSILADAMLQGPLKNEVLVIRSSQDFGLKGDLQYRHKEQVLSIVAIYLQSKTADCNSAVIRLADLSNYMNKECNKGSDKIYQSVSTFIDKAGYTYEDRLLFFKDCLADSCNKLTVDAKWLRDWGVHLIPATAATPTGYLRYEDDQLRG